jgi:hypothetical protein
MQRQRPLGDRPLTGRTFRAMTHRTTVAALVLAGAGMAGDAGCLGSIGDGASGRGHGSGSGASGTLLGADGGPTSAVEAFPCATTTPNPGPTTMLLLSRAQYLNTLRDLFGAVVPDLDSALGADDSYQTPQFGLVQADVDLTTLQNYQTAAETVAAAVVADPKTLSAIDPCASGASKRTCAQTFVQTFGALAYRAPVTDPADVARHMALYDVGATTSDAHGIEMVVRGMLQSPRFLYRVEIGTGEAVGPDAVKLSDYEIAARLSYILWNTVPDAPLTLAAAAGGLSTKDAVAAQLTRMIQDPKGQGLVEEFLEGLIQLSSLPYTVKDPTVYPDWTGVPTLPASMQGQARAFFDYVLGSQNGSLSSLLTSSTVFVNGDLASYYGATGQSTFQPVDLPTGKASGLLTLPALLTLMAKPDESWPIYRGKFVREALLCQELPAPPPNIPKPPDVQSGVSTRQRLSEHETNPQCSGCHALMDPIGFGFENYDGLGRFRTTDGNQPVDATGNVAAPSDITGPFDGVAQLATELAGSTQVQQCIARQWFRFTMNRYEQAPDNCSMKSVVDTFQSAGASLNVLPKALVESDAFLYRSPL